jgi:hypothetical protein
MSGDILSYLAGRGLPLEAVQRYRIGYLDGEDKTGTCLYRARAAFGLSSKKNADGTRTRSVLWIPRGLTIPLWQGEEAHRIRLRRRKEDLREGDNKYLLLEGSGQAPMVLPPAGFTPDMAVWVVVEAELDALAVHHACGGKIGVIAVLTNVGKPDAAAHKLLSRSPLILVALDFVRPVKRGDARAIKAGCGGQGSMPRLGAGRCRTGRTRGRRWPRALIWRPGSMPRCLLP